MGIFLTPDQVSCNKSDLIHGGTSFHALLDKRGWGKEAGGITLFAPTNDAWDNISGHLKQYLFGGGAEGISALRDTLAYHVVPREITPLTRAQGDLSVGKLQTSCKTRKTIDSTQSALIEKPPNALNSGDNDTKAAAGDVDAFIIALRLTAKAVLGRAILALRKANKEGKLLEIRRSLGRLGETPIVIAVVGRLVCACWARSVLT